MASRDIVGQHPATERIAELERELSNLYADILSISKQGLGCSPAFAQVAKRHAPAMRSLGIVREED